MAGAAPSPGPGILVAHVRFALEREKGGKVLAFQVESAPISSKDVRDLNVNLRQR